ncbi:hypothetical protein HDF16_001980 [Granulicella aggregans]|uniref:Integrase DNA-binding domain-containing protein n=2 Tax=Granulicella aggregans TaxID=474949 RepID=A0A7W7ZCB3_9BACT|nr:hypothetical protein [Granulicella aggregans]
MTLGRYPELYLALARDGHRQARRLLAAKVDPIEERKTERQAKHVSIANSFVSVVPK